MRNRFGAEAAGATRGRENKEAKKKEAMHG
jgi:hypothetical protein